MIMIKYLVLLTASLLVGTAYAGEALDISNAVGWWDANDVDGDGDESDNPSNTSIVTNWTDKSGEGNNLTPRFATKTPQYRTDNQSNNAVRLNSSSLTTGESNDFDFRVSGNAGGGSVFVVVHDAQNGAHETIISTRNGEDGLMIYNYQNRFQGWIKTAVGANNWNPTVFPTSNQNDTRVLEYKIKDTSREVASQGTRQSADLPREYNPNNPSNLISFNLGGHYPGTVLAKDTYINEVIVFKEFVSTSESILITNYLSEKWGTSLNDNERYVPTNSPSSAYIHDIGGFGRQTSTDSGHIRNISGMGGLRFSNTSTLPNGFSLMAGHNEGVGGLDSTSRLQREWYIDQTGASHEVTLSFTASEIGLANVNGNRYQLLHSNDGGVTFTTVGTDQEFTNGTVDFTITPTDGVYTLQNNMPQLHVKKTATAISDPINGTSAPKIIPGSIVEYTIQLSNSGHGVADDNSLVINDSLSSKLHLVGNAYGTSQTVQFNDACPTPDSSVAGTTSNLNLTQSNIVYTDADNSSVAAPTSINGTIRHIKIPIDGIMSGYSGSGNTPCFSVSYRCEVQ